MSSRGLSSRLTVVLGVALATLILGVADSPSYADPFDAWGTTLLSSTSTGAAADVTNNLGVLSFDMPLDLGLPYESPYFGSLEVPVNVPGSSFPLPPEAERAEEPTDTTINGAGPVEPPSIIGADDHKYIGGGNPQQSPYQLIVSMDLPPITSDGPGPNAEDTDCTGWLIGPRTIITAGHCVYDTAAGAFRAAIRVTPGKDGAFEPFAAQTVGPASLWSVCGYVGDDNLAMAGHKCDGIVGGNPCYDYGAIILPVPFSPGPPPPYFGFADIAANYTYLRVSGYPGESHPVHDSQLQYFDDNTRNAFGCGGLSVGHNADTWPGQSGSPVWPDPDPGANDVDEPDWQDAFPPYADAAELPATPHVPIVFAIHNGGVGYCPGTAGNCARRIEGGATKNLNFWLGLGGGREPALVALMDGGANITAGSGLPIGAVVGKMNSNITLGLVGGPCNVNIPLEFVMMNSTTDNGAGNLVSPLPATATIPGGENVLEPLRDDAGGGSPLNSIPAHVDRYPSYLNTMFDPDGSGPNASLVPRARYSGSTIVASEAWVVQLLVFDPGALATLPAYNPLHDMGSATLGYAMVLVFQDPTAAAATGPVTDYCSPFTATILLWGSTRDNPCTGAVPACPNNDAPCAVACGNNTCINSFVGAACPVLVDNGAGPCAAGNEAGCIRYQNPAAPGTHSFYVYLRSVATDHFHTVLALSPICIGGVDNDADGWCAVGGGAIPNDPNDANAIVTPEAYNLFVPFPVAHSRSGNSPPVREPIQLCHDGIDNDGDALIDALDAAAGACRPPSPLVKAPGDTDGDGYSDEAEIHVGTDALGRCGVGATPSISRKWPADLSDAGGFSRDKIDIADLASFVAGAPAKLNSSPGAVGFDVRWDIVPGPAGPANWINVVDLSKVVTFSPPMFGVKAFNGPKCSAHPLFGD